MYRALRLLMAIPRDERERILGIAQRVRRELIEFGRCKPGGMCFDSSVEISERLAGAGIPHEVVGGWFIRPLPERTEDLKRDGHVWIRFPQYDGAVLDATADQYGEYPEVWFPAEAQFYHGRESVAIRSHRPKKRAQVAGRLREGTMRRPSLGVKKLKVRVRNHLRHPPKSCLCHKSKNVDRARRGLVRRLG